MKRAIIKVTEADARRLRVACQLRVETCADNNELVEGARWQRLRVMCEAAEQRARKPAKGKAK